MNKNTDTFDKNTDINNINTDSSINNTPLIFKKKQKRSLIKSLVYVQCDGGKTRHYPPAAQE